MKYVNKTYPKGCFSRVLRSLLLKLGLHRKLGVDTIPKTLVTVDGVELAAMLVTAAATMVTVLKNHFPKMAKS